MQYRYVKKTRINTWLTENFQIDKQTLYGIAPSKIIGKKKACVRNEEYNSIS